MDLEAELTRCGCATRPARFRALVAEWRHRLCPGESAEALLADAGAVISLWAELRVLAGCPALPLHVVVEALRESDPVGSTAW